MNSNSNSFFENSKSKFKAFSAPSLPSGYIPPYGPVHLSRSSRPNSFPRPLVPPPSAHPFATRPSQQAHLRASQLAPSPRSRYKWPRPHLLARPVHRLPHPIALSLSLSRHIGNRGHSSASAVAGLQRTIATTSSCRRASSHGIEARAFARNCRDSRQIAVDVDLAIKVDLSRSFWPIFHDTAIFSWLSFYSAEKQRQSKKTLG